MHSTHRSELNLYRADLSPMPLSTRPTRLTKLNSGTPVFERAHFDSNRTS